MGAPSHKTGAKLVVSPCCSVMFQSSGATCFSPFNPFWLQYPASSPRLVPVKTQSIFLSLGLEDKGWHALRTMAGMSFKWKQVEDHEQ